MRKNDYRSFYQDKLKIDLTGLDIHHIDEDRSNNDILNLVALPSGLHKKFHFHKRGYENILDKMKTSLFELTEYEVNNMIELLNCYKECSEWIYKRDIRLMELYAK